MKDRLRRFPAKVGADPSASHPALPTLAPRVRYFMDSGWPKLAVVQFVFGARGYFLRCILYTTNPQVKVVDVQMKLLEVQRVSLSRLSNPTLG